MLEWSSLPGVQGDRNSAWCWTAHIQGNRCFVTRGNDLLVNESRKICKCNYNDIIILASYLLKSRNKI
jgi:hypothetical protein